MNAAARELVNMLSNVRINLLSEPVTKLDWEPLSQIPVFMSDNKDVISGYFDLNPFYIKVYFAPGESSLWQQYIDYYNQVVDTAKLYLV